MRFMVDKVTLGQVFLRVLLFSPVNIIPPVLRTHLHLHFAPTEQTCKDKKSSKIKCCFGKEGTLGRKILARSL